MGSSLARASIAAIVVVPILTWVIVTKSQGELFVRMFLSNFALAIQVIALPFIPIGLRNEIGHSLDSNELAVLIPAIFVIATMIALVLASIRKLLYVYGKDFAASLAIGYLAAIAGLQIVGALHWIFLVFLMSNVGPR